MKIDETKADAFEMMKRVIRIAGKPVGNTLNWQIDNLAITFHGVWDGPRIMPMLEMRWHGPESEHANRVYDALRLAYDGIDLDPLTKH